MKKVVAYKSGYGAPLETDPKRAYAWSLEKNSDKEISFSSALWILENRDKIKSLINDYEKEIFLEELGYKNTVEELVKEITKENNKMTKELIKGYTTEEIQGKIEWEGLEYFLLHYIDIDNIQCEDFKKSVMQFRLSYEDIADTLENEGINI